MSTSIAQPTERTVIDAVSDARRLGIDHGQELFRLAATRMLTACGHTAAARAVIFMKIDLWLSEEQVKRP
jgi:hypothetical protein